MSTGFPFWLAVTCVTANLPSSGFIGGLLGGTVTPHIFRDFSGLPFGLRTPHIGDRHIIMRITSAIFKDCGKQKISNFTLFTIYETAL